MSTLGHDQTQSANTKCLDGGTTNTTDSARGNWAQAIEVGLGVTDVNRGAAVKEK